MSEELKIFSVTLHFEMVVAAHSREEAERRAPNWVKDLDGYSATSFEIKELDDLPDGWLAPCFPFGAPPDKTISDYLP